MQIRCAHAPAGNGQISGWYTGGEPADGDVRTQALEDINKQVDVFLQCPADEIFRSGGEFLRHRRAFQNLQLMELDAVQGEGVDAGNVFQQGLLRFARQSQDEMAANRDTPLGGFPHGPFRTGEIVPAMYAQQGFVPAGFNPVLDPGAPE